MLIRARVDDNCPVKETEVEGRMKETAIQNGAKVGENEEGLPVVSATIRCLESWGAGSGKHWVYNTDIRILHRRGRRWSAGSALGDGELSWAGGGRKAAKERILATAAAWTGLTLFTYGSVNATCAKNQWEWGK